MQATVSPHTFIRRTICRIVAALDTCSRSTGFNEFDIVLVSKALASLRIAFATNTSRGVILPASVVRVQTREMRRINASCH
jgi:hypothetical protein